MPKTKPSVAADKLSSSPPSPTLGAWALPGQAPWASAFCVSLETAQGLSQQFMERVNLRAKEWAAHGPPPYSPADLADLSMASMRWVLQECGHSLQDLMSAALSWRGEWNGEPSAAQLGAPCSPHSLTEALDSYQQLMAQQSKAWADWLNHAARQRRT